MEFLKDLAVPQSFEHLQLLLFVSNLLCVVYFPYLAFLLGSTTLSLYYRRRQRNRDEARFAKDLLEIPLFSVVGFFSLGVLPALSLVFVFAQVFQKTSSIAPSTIALGFLFSTAAMVMLYVGKYQMKLAGLFGTVRSEFQPSHVRDELESTINLEVSASFMLGRRLTRYGLLVLWIGAWFTTGAIAIASNPDSWQEFNSIFFLFIYPGAIVAFLQLITIGLGITGLLTLFVSLVWRGGIAPADENYKNFVRLTCMRIVAASVLVQPILLTFRVLSYPTSALSGLLFIFAGITLVGYFLAGLFIYGLQKTLYLRYVKYALVALGLSAVFQVTTDHASIKRATTKHAAELAVIHGRYSAEFKAKLGIGGPAPSGEDLFNAKCSACHLFDQKKVGPPYNLVLTKYDGRKKALIDFVLRPKPVDPAYPPMPSQGLRPAEADSVVSYLLRLLAEKGKS